MTKNYGEGRLEQRGPRSWLVTVELQKTNGRRRRHRFTVRGSKRDAHRAKREALQRRDHGLAVAPDRITVADYLDQWLARHYAEGHIRPKSHERYAGVITNHIVPAIGDVRLQQLRADQIETAKAAWLERLSAASVTKILVVLGRALKDAVRLGLLPHSPMETVTRPKVRRTERRALDEGEIAKLLEAARGTELDTPISLALATGVRQGELLGLSWSDVSLERREVTIARTLSYASGELHLGDAKTQNARRTIELSDATVASLRAHSTAQKEHRLRIGPAWDDRGLVFPTQLGTPQIPQGFYRAYKAVVVASEIGDPDSVTFHTLRHTAASMWLRGGVDVFTVSRRLGHSNPGFTLSTYAHLIKGQQRQAAEALDHLLAR